MKRSFLFVFIGWMSCLLPTNAVNAQQESLIGFVREPTVVPPPAQPVFWNDNRFNLQMGLDVYTAYGLNDTGNELPGYFYSYNRQGEANLNLGYLRGSYVDNRFKAHLGLMAGTYRQRQPCSRTRHPAQHLGGLCGCFAKRGQPHLARSRSFRFAHRL